MPDLPQNNTFRLWVDYTSRGIKHSAMHRYAGVSGGENATIVATALANFYKGLLPASDGVQGARWSPAGADFSIDTGLAPIAGTGVSDPWLEDPDSAFITLPLHSLTSGAKGLLCFYAPLAFGQIWPVTNRYGPGQNALWNGIRDDWWDIARNPVEGVNLIVIDNTIPTAKGYLNFRKNGYRQTKQRT